MNLDDYIEGVLTAVILAVPWILYFGYVMKP